MKRVAFVVVVSMLVSAPALLASSSTDAEVAQRPTFYKDVLPILQSKCQDCHRPEGLNMAGMIAPMSFMTYDEVRPWARSMARAVDSTYMPPWGASEAQHGIFKNERTLTQQEIETIVRWARTGAAAGDQADAPPAVTFASTGWNLGEPDLVVEFDEPFWVEDDVEDLYQNITVELTEDQLPEDRWIESIEFRPGSRAVHHIIGYATSEGFGADEATARGMIGGNAPGKEQDVFPSGYGILLEKGSKITFQMHYHKEAGPGTGVFDDSAMGIRFARQPVTHPVTISNVAYYNFEIPPNYDRWRVGAAKVIEEDSHLIALMPHMHLRGVYARYEAFYPDGTSEELLEVPEYDFNWQISYNYAEPKFIPAGTRLEMEIHFANTDEQASKSGFNPDRAVRFGGPTTDEMDLAWYTIAPAQPVELPAAQATGGGR